MDANTTFGTDMCVQGEPMKVPPRKKQQVQVLPASTPGTSFLPESPNTRGQRQRQQQQEEEEEEEEDEQEEKKEGGLKQYHPRQHKCQPQSEIQKSPIATSSSSPSSSNKASTPASPLSRHQSNRGRDSGSALKSHTQSPSSPHNMDDFDDSDDDLSVNRVDEDSQQASPALHKLDNAQLTAHVRGLVAVPLAVPVRKFELDLPDEPTAPAAAGKLRQVLKKGGGAAAKKAAYNPHQENVSAIPIKTYDPFA
jgi:hypothetical protein